MNIRAETIKLPEENISSKLLEINLSSDFLDLTPKAKATKAKVIRTMSNFSFCRVKKTINKMDGRKNLHIIHEMSISKIYKKLIELRKNKHSRLENGQRT